ncbi:MAG TPA: LytTR family DNA-binding domain-containing protein [Chryseolinea sp.]|nr:LytTR family DNA-binding domain-containing protein [Chryseolinea sp.]
MINCAIVDDERLAQEGMADYVGQVEFLNLVGFSENPVQLISLLDKQPIDLIFLDIHMPKMSGIDFLKATSNPPMVIITTAFPNFALESFQLNVLDYMVKPITFERFMSSAYKARDYFKLLVDAKSDRSAATDKEGYFFIKCGNKFEKIVYDEILFIEGLQNYVVIHTTKGRYTTLLTLKNLEERLDANMFVRTHKSFIVSLNKIDGLEGHELFIKNGRVPIGRNHREMIIQKVLGNKLITREQKDR